MAKGKAKQGTVYTLTDPRDGRVRYVGKTTQALHDRLGGHLASPTNPAMRVWISMLGGQGMVPYIEAVATAPADTLSAEEDRQIRKHAREGHRLLNAPYYQQNLTDLVTPIRADPAAPSPQVTAQPQEHTAERQSPLQSPTREKRRIRRHRSDAGARIRRLFNTFYLDTARNHAVGTTSTTAAALGVAILSPIFLVAVVWHVVMGTTVLRRLAAAAVYVAGAWNIGFDRLIEDSALLAADFALAHVPVAELAGFWRTYLSEPFRNIGVFLWVPVSVLPVVLPVLAYGCAAQSVEQQRRRPAALTH